MAANAKNSTDGLLHKLGSWAAKSISAGAVAMVVAVAVVLSVAFCLRILKPVTKIAVTEFDVPPGLRDLTNGRILANHLADSLRSIATEYTPTYSSVESLKTIRRLRLRAEGIPLETSVEIKGINLRSALVIWDKVRTHRIVIGGELLPGSGKLILKARMEGGAAELPEATIQDIRKDLDRASLRLATEIIKEVSPQALGLYYLRENDYQAAANAFSYWSQKDPNDATRHFYIGWAYSALGKATREQMHYQRALDEFKTVLRAGADADAINGIGIVYLNQAEQQHYQQSREQLVSEAYRRFSLARSLAHDDPTIANNLGYAMVVVGCPREGLGNLEEATRLDPQYAGAWINYGDAVMDLRRNELERGLFPGCSSADSVEQCRWSAMEHAFGEAVRLTQNSPDAEANLGVTYCLEGKPDAAMGVINYLQPGDAFTYFIRGCAAELKSQNSTALREYRAAAELAPEEPLLWARYGRALRRAGRREDALRVFQRGLHQSREEQSNDRDELLSQFADLLRAQKRQAEALVLTRQIRDRTTHCRDWLKATQTEASPF